MPLPVPAVLALAGTVATVAWVRRRRASTLTPAQSDTSPSANGHTGASSGGGTWSKKPGSTFELAAHVVSFLDALVARSGLTLVVTDGSRTPRRQAEELLASLEQGVNVWGLYSQDDLVTEAMEGYPDLDAMEAILQSQVDRGLYLSDHMRGDAVDLRTRGLSADQVDLVMATAVELGAQALDEGDHVHVEDIPGGVA